MSRLSDYLRTLSPLHAKEAIATLTAFRKHPDGREMTRASVIEDAVTCGAVLQDGALVWPTSLVWGPRNITTIGIAYAQYLMGDQDE